MGSSSEALIKKDVYSILFLPLFLKVDGVMKVCLVLGTRPEIIKMSPLIREFERHAIPYFIIHTGQHYSYEMDRLFYQQLGIGEPRYNLGIKSRSPFFQSEHTGRMLIDIEKILLQEKPDIVLVEGDTNTVLAGSICVNKLRTSPINMQIRLGHVEAGLRSYDRTMTEEINRVLADHMSDYLFTPTEIAKSYLLREAISEDKIYVTGNTIVDAVYYYLPKAKACNILTQLGLRVGDYFFVTAHRQENVDDPIRLRGILDGFSLLHREYQIPIVYPIHPRTRKMISKFNYQLPIGVIDIEPVGFFESLQLEMNARLIITDSGGIQEEASILHVPCITIRDNTERPETVTAGYNLIVGTIPERIVEGAKTMLSCSYEWKSLYGDGNAAEYITQIFITTISV